MKRTAWFIVTLPAAVLLTTVLVALATRTTPPVPHATGPASVDSPSSPVPGEAALRATINPETGQVEVSSVPLPMELDAATQEALRQDDEGLKQTFLPDGTVLINMQGRFQSVATVRIDENGKRVICSESAKDVHSAMQETPVAAPAPSRTPEVR